MIERNNPAWVLLGAVPEALLVLNNHGTIELANQHAEKLFGLPSAELQGSSLGQHLFTQDHSLPVSAVTSLFVSREPLAQTIELFGQHQNGSTFPVGVTLSTTSFGGEEFVLVVLRDMMPIKRREAELRLALLQLDCLSVSSALLDAQGQIVRVNEGWRQFARENGANTVTAQGVGENYLEVCRNADNPTATAIADGIEALLGGTQLEFEVVYQYQSPSQLRWIRLQGRRPVDVRVVVLSHTEITEHYLAEAQTQLDAILACAPAFVLSVGLDGMIQFINRTRSHQDRKVLGSSMLSFVSSEDQTKVATTFQQVIATRTSRSYEVSVPSPDSRAARYSCVMSPMLHGGKMTGVVIVAQDITEKKQMEAQLIASERMASMGLLAAGVAHEINNPLTAVAANLELSCLALAAPSLPNTQELRLWLLEAKEAAGRVRSIVRDLRLFSRAEGEDKKPVALWPVMESALRMAQNEIRHRARLVTQCDTAPLVDANESRLGQVFLNLIMNAAQAIPEGHADLNEIRVTLSTAKNGDALLEISDTGCGMSAEVQQQIFDPFFTTKPAGVGTGLGLSICSKIINGFQGRIEVESSMGKGTIFRVYLPPAPEGKPRSEKLPAPSIIPRKRGRILVIDDDPVIGSIIRRILFREHEVSVLFDAKEAMKLITSGERFDLILCDVMMAEMTGIEFSLELQRSEPEQASRIVFMTGGVFTPKTHEFLTQTKNPQLEKPFDLLTIHNLVNQFVQ